MKSRMNRKLIFTKERIPIIYLRIKGEEVFYIGETDDLRQGRPFRNGDTDQEKEQIGDYNYVICLNAPKNKKRREYWEACLIVKYKPLMQNIEYYLKRLKCFNAHTQKETEEHQAKAVDRFTTYNNNNLRKNIKRHMLKGLTMYVKGNDWLKIISGNKHA